MNQHSADMGYIGNDSWKFLFWQWLLKSFFRKALHSHTRALSSLLSFFQQWMPKKKWARSGQAYIRTVFQDFSRTRGKQAFYIPSSPQLISVLWTLNNIPFPPCELHKIALILHAITDMACTGTMLHSYLTTTGTLTLADPIPWENVNRIYMCVYIYI